MYIPTVPKRPFQKFHVLENEIYKFGNMGNFWRLNGRANSIELIGVRGGSVLIFYFARVAAVRSGSFGLNKAPNL